MVDATVVLNTATVDGFPETVFCIGPFGDKVSFASQQKRALNLVWALKERGILHAGANVAVVGGGLAGIMACSALRGQGCIVTLYEANGGVLERQLDARHRLIHPTINAWPMVDYIRSTTDYPFYDWFVGPCTKIVERLKKDWDRDHDAIVRSFKKFAEVEKIENCEEGGVRLNVSYGEDSSTPSVHEEIHDIVLVATGFGEEVILTKSDAPSYWDPDSLARVQRNKKKYKKIVVSGTGDGGLIDCARLAHKGFSDGSLAVRLVGALRHPGHGPDNPGHPLSPHEARIREIENEATRRKTKGETADEISRFLEAEYKQVIDNFEKRTRSILDDSLDSPKRITLYGQIERPFTIEASPVNKLLLAHMLLAHPSLYQKADVSQEGGQLYVKIHGRTRRNKISPDFFVCRHGAKPPIVDIIEGFDLDAFKGKQKEIADILDIDSYSHRDFSEYLDISRESDVKKNGFASDRIELADEYSKRYFDQRADPQFCIDTKAYRFGFTKTDAYLKSKEKTGGYDKEIFGVPIFLKEDPSVMTTLVKQRTSDD